MTSTFIVSNFNQQYLFALRGGLFNRPPKLAREQFWGESAAENFVYSLGEDSFSWRQLVTGDHNFSDWQNAHPHAAIEQYIINALVSGNIDVYRMPDFKALSATKEQRRVTQANGKRVQFVPASYLLTNQSAQSQAIDSAEQANTAIADCQMLPNQYSDLSKALNLGTQPDALAKALQNGQVVIIADDVVGKPDASDSTASSSEEILYAPPPPRTAAENAEKAKSTQQTSPQSLDDCVERLAVARQNIIDNGYQAKYTDEDLVASANRGDIKQERFLVSFQPKPNNEDALLAMRKEGNYIALWATSLDMLENADTDPQTIADLLATGCDPDTEYVLHIIDRGESLGEFGENTFVPTWDNLAAPAQSYLAKRFGAEAMAGVLNDQSQVEYAQHMEGYWAAGLNQFDKDDKRFYRDNLSVKEASDFKARHALRTEFGCNHEFTGNGLTQCRHSGNEHGVVEALTLQNNPIAVSQMKNVKTLNLTPINKG